MKKMHINRRKILSFLITTTMFFAGINLAILLLNPNFNAGVMTGLTGLFNMNAEVSIPTWYAQMLLFVASSLLFLCGYAQKKSRNYWYSLAGIFLFASIDEGASIHELLTMPVRQFFDISSGFLYYSWFIVYLLIVLILVFLYWKFYMSLPSKLKLLLFSAAFIFMLGAVGFEAIGASIAAVSGESGFSYSLVTIAEETLEMLGVSIFIYALLDQLHNIKYTFIAKF